MDDYEILCGITLNRIFGYEPATARALISRFGSPGAVFSQSSSTLDEVFGPFNKFRPLRGRKVVLFPDTDPEGKTFARWYDIAQQVMAEPFWEDSPPIRVSPVLELHATEEQKRGKIDLVDFVFKL